MPAEAWLDYLQRARRSSQALPGALLCLDPGETFGWALFRNGELVVAGQEHIDRMSDIEHLVVRAANIIPRKGRPTIVPGYGRLERIVMESYRVYPWQLERHSFSDVPTLRYIGAVQMLASQLSLPITLQAAAVAKEFASDSRLKNWGLYQKAHRHANDAIRHGAHYLLFGGR